MKNKSLLTVAALTVLTSTAHAQFSLINRFSEARYTWLYGFADDIRNGNGNYSEADLIPVDSTALIGSSTGNGFYPPSGTIWNATVTWDLSSSYALNGTLGSSTQITSSGSSTAVSAQSNATSDVESHFPGNEQTLDFC